MINLTEIDLAKEVVIVCNAKTFALASALYTYALVQHKKVSLVSQEEIPRKFSYLPWFDKVRLKSSFSESKMYIHADDDVLRLVQLLQDAQVKINTKMAVALYAGLLIKYDFFSSDACNETVFKIAAQLLELGASHSQALSFLKKTKPLSYLRLQAKMYANTLLQANATLAVVSLFESDLHESGADLEDAYAIMHEILELVHVQEVHLISVEKENKIIKSIQGNRFEK